jgi:hypothetical protein
MQYEICVVIQYSCVYYCDTCYRLAAELPIGIGIGGVYRRR